VCCNRLYWRAYKGIKHYFYYTYQITLVIIISYIFVCICLNVILFYFFSYVIVYFDFIFTGNCLMQNLVLLIVQFAHYVNCLMQNPRFLIVQIRDFILFFFKLKSIISNYEMSRVLELEQHFLYTSRSRTEFSNSCRAQARL
jgi:hypothetical protein